MNGQGFLGIDIFLGYNMNPHWFSGLTFGARNLIGMWKNLKYTEARLEPGEQILVWGKGEWRKAIDFQLPEHFNDILVITSKDDKGIFVSNVTNFLANTWMSRPEISLRFVTTNP